MTTTTSGRFGHNTEAQHIDFKGSDCSYARYMAHFAISLVLTYMKGLLWCTQKNTLTDKRLFFDSTINNFIYACSFNCAEYTPPLDKPGFQHTFWGIILDAHRECKAATWAERSELVAKRSFTHICRFMSESNNFKPSQCVEALCIINAVMSKFTDHLETYHK
jgi:hypothetical protein